jgi:hypothetical protein
MKAFLAAVFAVIGIGFVASFALETQQRNADVAFSTKGARIDNDPRFGGGPVQKH